MNLVLSAITFSQITLLVNIKASAFSLQYLPFLPIYQNHWHKPEAGMYRLISSHPGLPEPRNGVL